MFLESTVGEVQARNIHSTLNHPRQGFYIVTGRADSGNNLGFAELGFIGHGNQHQGFYGFW
jgi:hypothetical protein